MHSHVIYKLLYLHVYITTEKRKNYSSKFIIIDSAYNYINVYAVHV